MPTLKSVTVLEFQSFSFSCTRRDANKAAHACGRITPSIDTLDFLFEVIPGFLIEVAQSDMLSSMRNKSLTTIAKIKVWLTHLFSHCRYSKRLWGLVKCWIGIPSICTHEWTDDLTLLDWWAKMLKDAMANRKAMASLTMLVTWTIWKERNARVFNHKSAPLPSSLTSLKPRLNFG
jgi:hypothetical protein